MVKISRYNKISIKPKNRTEEKIGNP